MGWLSHPNIYIGRYLTNHDIFSSHFILKPYQCVPEIYGYTEYVRKANNIWEHCLFATLKAKTSIYSAFSLPTPPSRRDVKKSLSLVHLLMLILSALGWTDESRALTDPPAVCEDCTGLPVSHFMSFLLSFSFGVQQVKVTSQGNSLVNI